MVDILYRIDCQTNQVIPQSQLIPIKGMLQERRTYHKIKEELFVLLPSISSKIESLLYFLIEYSTHH